MVATKRVSRGSAGGSEAVAPSFDDPALYSNREQSWLDFNQRVLAEASDARNPLLERVKFIAIAASNLDEFATKRLGWLKRALQTEPLARTIDGLTIVEQTALVVERCRRMMTEMSRYWEDELRPSLAAEGIEICPYATLDAASQDQVRKYFERSIFPTLTPLAVDPAHPFPFISSQSISLALLVRNPLGGEERFARVKVPANRPRFVPVGQDRFVPLEDVIGAYAGALFPGMEIVSRQAVRVIRSAEVSSPVGEEADDLLELVENELKRRRLAPAVRLEVSGKLSQQHLDLLLEELELEDDDVFQVDGLIDLADLFQLAALDRPALRYAAYSPAVPGVFSRTAQGDSSDVFSVIRDRDVLVHHPYESFDHTVAEFIQRAAEDSQVLAIKQTLYRTSADSPILESLIEASERGKQVAVLVELTARFDEANNIEWARKLENAGVHVAYGVPGYKIHSKVALVVREEARGLRLYGHISTGNYNSGTARVYTDFGLFTSNSRICADLVQIFNYLTGYSQQPECRSLLVAPFTLRETFARLVQREISAARKGEPARIVMKMNALEDYEFSHLLYEAAAAGVKVDLIIRGICRLQPGAPGTGDNLRVVSVVGKYLEHSRVFTFHNGGDPTCWIGSADLMKRNLDERIEVVAPISDPTLKAQLQGVLDLLLEDRRRGWRLTGREWSREPGVEAPGSHELLEARAPFS
ncbi:MAG: polyphosphate kinase 1 [Dehalococcoidia bacterium]